VCVCADVARFDLAGGFPFRVDHGTYEHERR
jgi:hypothetical protein